MNQLTPEQHESLQTWAAKRDSLLKDISQKQVEYDSLLKRNSQLTKENSNLVTEIAGHKKSVEIMEEHESERSVLISRDLAEGIKKKTELESEITFLYTETQKLQEKKDEIKKDIEMLEPLHEKFVKQIHALEHTVNHVVKVNEKNTDRVNIMIANLKKVLSGIKLKA